jgi:hypothetical protein
VLLQPLPGFVTVTVYVPAAFTVGLAVDAPAVIPGPDQLYVTPAVDEETVIIPEGFKQFNTKGTPGVTLGKAPVFVTFTVVVFVQPFDGSVTVTVYVPAAFTVADAVVAPDNILGPDQL